MQELEQLNDRLDTLLKKYSAIQVENKRLKESVTQQTKTIEALNGKLAELEQQLLARQIGAMALPDDEKEKLKKQLDNVIGEIDKILTTLHD